MKIFVSSLISGMEPIRESAREVITTLRHQPIMAEDFGAQPRSPQLACLDGIRQSDLIVLILGEHYGAVQGSGLSATHEEYKEANGRKPIISFVQENVDRDFQQADFVREVQNWEGGLFRESFRGSADFKVALTRALHDYELAIAVGPVDENELLQRAKDLLPPEDRGYSSGATLDLVVVGGPRQPILRPIEIEQASLAEALIQKGLFGQRRILNLSDGVTHTIENDSLVIVQRNNRAKIKLNEQGSISIIVPIARERSPLPELIHEDVQSQLTDALDFASWTLDHVDATQRLTHVAVAARLRNCDYMGWRTRRQSEGSPGQISISTGMGPRTPVILSRPRAALRLDSVRIVEDLVVPLRRQRQ
jgi:hypothetical protein